MKFFKGAAVKATLVTSLTAIAMAGAFSMQAKTRLPENMSETITFRLPEDSYDSSLTPNWEVDLNNADAYENQMSMAVSGGYLYVCISLYSPSTGNDYSGNPVTTSLMLRRYSLEDGAEETLLVPTDEAFQAGYYNSYTIVSDESGQLLVGLIRTKPSSAWDTPREAESAILQLRRFDPQSGHLDSSWEASCEIPQRNIRNGGNAPYADYTWMERIHWIKGSVLTGEYEFSACVGWCEDGQYVFKNSYCTFKGNQDAASDADAGLRLASELPLSDMASKYAPDNRQGSLDVALYPDGEFNSDKLVLTYNSMGDNGAYTYPSPALFVNGTETDVEFPFGRDRNCRGFYPFSHNGHSLVAFANSHNDQQAQFSLVTWPESTSFKNVTMMAAAFPSSPFPGCRNFYTGGIRQLATTEPERGGASRAGTEAVKTHLYVCAPGSGVASYTLSTPMISTGIETPLVEAGEISLNVNDGSLYVSGIADGTMVTIHDLSGRQILTTTVSDDTPVSLSDLPSGIYVARAASATLKIVLR